MRVSIHHDSVHLWASAHDTRQWARKPGAAWPCSTLSGSRFFAAFDTNGLYEFTVNGREPSTDIDGNEFSAICADLLAKRLDREHPVWFVTVGQFHAERA